MGQTNKHQYVIKIESDDGRTASAKGQSSEVSSDGGIKTNTQQQSISKSKAVTAAFVLKGAKQTANFVISNYGNLTGDSIGQESIQRTMSRFNSAVGIGAAFLIGGPIAGGVALGSQIITDTLAFAQMRINNHRDDVSAQLAKNRQGYIGGGRQ